MRFGGIHFASISEVNDGLNAAKDGQSGVEFGVILVYRQRQCHVIVGNVVDEIQVVTICSKHFEGLRLRNSNAFWPHQCLKTRAVQYTYCSFIKLKC